MVTIQACDLPQTAFLRQYKTHEGYADCYVAGIPMVVSLERFVEAFYTSNLFKTERTLLQVFAGYPSSDHQAHLISTGEASSFSVWKVEQRALNQLLLADASGRTRSWFMRLANDSAQASTRLYFGSAVTPKINVNTGASSMGLAFYALGGFHRLYSRMLLKAACSRLLAERP